MASGCQMQRGWQITGSEAPSPSWMHLATVCGSVSLVTGYLGCDCFPPSICPSSSAPRSTCEKEVPWFGVTHVQGRCRMGEEFSSRVAPREKQSATSCSAGAVWQEMWKAPWVRGKYLTNCPPCPQHEWEGRSGTFLPACQPDLAFPPNVTASCSHACLPACLSCVCGNKLKLSPNTEPTFHRSFHRFHRNVGTWGI